MIDREKVIKELEEAKIMLMRAVDRGGEMAVMGAFKCFNHVTDALALLKERSEQKHGHWVLDPNGMDWNIPAWRCSECHCKNDNIPPNLERTNPLRWSGSKYCPNCGAKMDEAVSRNE